MNFFVEDESVRGVIRVDEEGRLKTNPRNTKKNL